MRDINSYIWKDRRVTSDRSEKQVTMRLVDMDVDQLQNCYNICKDMLYNSNPKLPGRMIVINNIEEQKSKCIAERCLRWFMSITRKQEDGTLEYIYPNAESVMNDLRSWATEFQADENTMLKEFLEVPAEYRNVRVSTLEAACRDALGAFDHSKISFSFIYDLGIYPTQEELKNIDEDLRNSGLNPDDYTIQTKIEKHVKIPLGIRGAVVKINPRGLTLTEFKDMINMKHFNGYRMDKYSKLSTDKLVTLSTKVLYALEEKVKFQAKGWKERMAQIEEVANYHGFKLN